MNWNTLLSDARKGDASHRKDQSKNRNAFEQDYDRIVFSHAFRSLQDKTQVFPLATQTFVHTRLTHSLEVSSVARSLGKLAGESLLELDPEMAQNGVLKDDFAMITSSAALAHDIGNPPFGHAGESAISEYFAQSEMGSLLKELLTEHQYQDLCNFEGNAQGFRLLTEGGSQGLKITYATLAAFSKYPCASSIKKRDPKRKSQKKYGFYQSSLNNFIELTDRLELKWLNKHTWARHPLAFLVEAADDICYAIIDLEDGTNLGLVPFETTKKLLSEIIGDKFDEQKLKEKVNIREKTGILRALAINQLIRECVEVFVENNTGMLAGDFDKSLTELIPSAKSLRKILALSVDKIYRSEIVTEKEVAGFEILNGLLETFAPAFYYKISDMKKNWRYDSIIRLLPEQFQQALTDINGDNYKAMLLCLDFISGLSDGQALRLYQNIKGISLPGY